MCSSPSYILCRFHLCKSSKSRHVTSWSLASVEVLLPSQVPQCSGGSWSDPPWIKEHVKEEKVAEEWKGNSSEMIEFINEWRWSRSSWGWNLSGDETPPITKLREVHGWVTSEPLSIKWLALLVALLQGFFKGGWKCKIPHAGVQWSTPAIRLLIQSSKVTLLKLKLF
jgi:hypothetical protein